MLHEILSTSGKTASLSSLRFRIGDTVTMNDKKMTMPGRFFIQKFLHQARKAGCRYAVLEVTSEGITQFRHRYIRFNTAVMTNVAPEHIEAHGGFENYLRAKLDLFWRLPKHGFAVVNSDDPKAERFTAATEAANVYYGEKNIILGGRTFLIKHAVCDTTGVNFEIDGKIISSPLFGMFNFHNILAAVAVGLSQHVSIDAIASAVARVSGIPGRMEFIRREPFAVVIDYAHTPDSLRQVYQTLRGQMPNAKCQMLCVLGSAGGGRDKWKRPEMGSLAAQFCDEIIVTNEDPYDENPAAILSEIEAGFSHSQNYRKILDRREAIRYALKSAKEGDIVILTGKGAELWIMGPNGSKIPWNEKRVIEEELKKMSKS